MTLEMYCLFFKIFFTPQQHEAIQDESRSFGFGSRIINTDRRTSFTKFLSYPSYNWSENDVDSWPPSGLGSRLTAVTL